MENGEDLSLEPVQAFPTGNEETGFKAPNRKELYEWTQRTLCMQGYAGLHRSGKGPMKRHLGKVTGLSRAQVTRLIGQYAESGIVRTRQGRGQRFTARYTPADIALPAEVDEAHETLSGPATQKILCRQYHEFAEAGYERLAEISVAHIYNLRKRRSYREHRMVVTKTRPAPVAIGERRKPEPGGRPGYLRVDTVHQGDPDGADQVAAAPLKR